MKYTKGICWGSGMSAFPLGMNDGGVRMGICCECSQEVRVDKWSIAHKHATKAAMRHPKRKA